MIQIRQKIALISGITGQDGSYLAEFLLGKGYQVHGIIRRASTFNTDRIDHIYGDPHENEAPLHLHYGDLMNAARLRQLLEEIQPDEIYNLGAQSHVRVSFDQAEYTADVVATGTLRFLEAFREYSLARCVKRGSIRQVPRRCSAHRRHPKMNLRHFILAVPTR